MDFWLQKLLREKVNISDTIYICIWNKILEYVRKGVSQHYFISTIFWHYLHLFFFKKTTLLLRIYEIDSSFPLHPGLKSQSKSALNSAVSEISKISVLISAVSELFSAGFLWISAVERWIKTKWKTNENASCKFEKVLGSRKTCSFGVYQLWKKSIRRNSSQKFELTHPPLPHASWSHVPCRIVKRLKYRVKSGLKIKEKLC